MADVDKIKTAIPQLIADVTLYPNSEGGRHNAVPPGFRCPCFRVKSTDVGGWDCVFLNQEWLALGQTHRVGLQFLSGKLAADELRAAGTFYLGGLNWIGEAVVVA